MLRRVHRLPLAPGEADLAVLRPKGSVTFLSTGHDIVLKPSRRPMEMRWTMSDDRPVNRMILLALVLGTFMTALDATIVSVALPTIAQELGEAGHDTRNISWVLLIYTLMLCCFILLWSKVGSRKGYKKTFIAGVWIFVLSSFLIGVCGLFPDLGLGAIILLRALQGIGAGMVTAMSLAMVSIYLPKSSRGASIGAIVLAGSAGTAFGPALGGILASFHWSFIFFINVPVGALCLYLCWRHIRGEEHLEDSGKKLDVLGAVLIFAMVFTLIYYLNQGEDIGWTSDSSIVIVVLLMLFAGAAYWRESTSEDPLISTSILDNLYIRRGCTINMLLFMAMAGSYLLLPYYLQFDKGYDTIEYGFILIANSVGMMLAGSLVGRIADRTGENRKFVIIGAMISALGFFMMMRFDDDTGLAWILLSLVVMGTGVGMASVACTGLSFARIPEGQESQLSGLTNTFRQAGSSAGVAILNAVFMSSVVLAPLDLTPGFRHAFFIAAVICLVAFVMASGLKDAGRI